MAEQWFDPGTGAPRHTHGDVEETITVLRGAALFSVDDGEALVEEGCTIVLPPFSHHGFVNAGEGELHVMGIWSVASVPTEYVEEPDRTYRIGGTEGTRTDAARTVSDSMPNPDNTKWIGMVLNREITPGPPMQSVDDIPGRRAFWDVDALQPLEPPRVAATHEVELREGLRAELYVPEGEGPFPCAVYLHGGWWIMWSAPHVRRIATRMAERGFVVLNLDYRLAPEHPFPAAVEDCAFAARWLAENAATYGGDGSRLLVAGDSVGANLSAVTVAAVPDLGIRGAVLLYGVFDLPAAMQEPLTNAGVVEIATLAYLGAGFTKRWRDPLVSPINADLSRFPPCYVSCGDEDSLLGQSLSMAKALHLANVPLTVSVVPGTDHGFVYLEHALPAATPEVERMLDWMTAAAA